MEGKGWKEKDGREAMGGEGWKGRNERRRMEWKRRNGREGMEEKGWKGREGKEGEGVDLVLPELSSLIRLIRLFLS